MSALLVAAVVVAAVAAYLFTGWRYIAPGWVAREVSRQAEAYPSLASDSSAVAGWRRSAAGEGIFVGLIWPLYLAGRLLTGRIAAAAPLTDFEARQQIAERDERIARLERELGVGQR